MKKIIFLFAAFALIGCSSNPKKEEVVTTTETSKVEESTQVAEASLEDELEVEEEIEIQKGETRTARSFPPTDAEMANHKAFLEKIKEPIWQKLSLKDGE